MRTILGTADIFSALLLTSQAVGVEIPVKFLALVSGYLIFKGLYFFFDIGSLIDMIGGLLVLAGLFLSLPDPVLFSIAAWLGIKGTVSLLG